MTQLTSDLSRLLKIHSIEGDIIVTIGPEGVSFRVKGTKKSIQARWDKVVAACDTPHTVPSYLMNRPLEFLQWAGKEVEKRKLKRIDKNSSLGE